MLRDTLVDGFACLHVDSTFGKWQKNFEKMNEGEYFWKYLAACIRGLRLSGDRGAGAEAAGS